MEEGEPNGGIAARLGNHFVGNSGGFRTARQNRQFIIEADEIKLDHHAVMTLLD